MKRYCVSDTKNTKYLQITAVEQFKSKKSFDDFQIQIL